MKKNLHAHLFTYGALALLVLAGGMFIYSRSAPDAERNKLRAEQPLRISPTLPQSVSFAGEDMPLALPDVRERLEREVLINTFYHSATILTLKKANRWKAPMLQILKEQNVPEDFFYLMIAESGMRNATSPAGAQGFWQFMLPAARQYGLVIDESVDERNDPIKSTYAACRYLKAAYDKFGNWTMVAAAYNTGMAGAADQSQQQQVANYYDLYWNPETARYVFRILAWKLLEQNPEQYGFKLFTEDLYTLTPCNTLTLQTGIHNLPVLAQQNGTNYKTLRMYNPWLRKTTLNVPQGKSYTLYVPAKPGEAAAAQVGLVTE
jgi:hypothetical protein